MKRRRTCHPVRQKSTNPIIIDIFFSYKYKNNFVISGTARRATRSVTSLLKDVQMYQVACVYMPTRLFVNISQIYVPMYLHVSLNMPATSLATVPLAIYLSSLVASLIIERLNTKLGRKISYAIGVIMGLSACTWIRFGVGDTFITYELYSVSILLGKYLLPRLSFVYYPG